MGHESNGLGLTISKRIAKCLGGDLVHIPQGTGCRFDLKLRLKVFEQNVFNTHALKFIEAEDGQMSYIPQLEIYEVKGENLPA